jgi:hypothetical protein
VSKEKMIFHLDLRCQTVMQYNKILLIWISFFAVSIFRFKLYEIGNHFHSNILNGVQMKQSIVSEYDANNPTDVQAQTYTLNCKNTQGDMIYITDLTPGGLGHGIAEVEVYKSLFGGKFNLIDP